MTTLLEQVTDIATCLGADWQVVEPELEPHEPWSYDIKRTDGLRIVINRDAAWRKFEISASDKVGMTRGIIRVTAAREPEAITSDIKQRLLPKVSQNQKDDFLKRQMLRTARNIAGIVGAEFDGSAKNSFEHQFSDAVSVECRVNRYSSINLKLISLTESQATFILEFLRDWSHLDK